MEIFYCCSILLILQASIVFIKIQIEDISIWNIMPRTRRNVAKLKGAILALLTPGMTGAEYLIHIDM
jgi:hypothetical protein